MASAKTLVKQVVEQADIVLVVLDARDAAVTINKDLQRLLGGKRFLYVINKIDLVEEETWQALRTKYTPSIAVSSTKHLGTMMLLRKINEIARGGDAVVGVIGYPNTGKSSLINALRGRGAASTSPVAGHTKAIQKVRVSSHVILLDTPGVLSYHDKREGTRRSVHEYLGTVDVHKLSDPDITVANLMRDYPGLVERGYGVEPSEDHEHVIAAIAKRKNVLKPGGEPDLDRMARQILIDYQRGKLVP